MIFRKAFRQHRSHRRVIGVDEGPDLDRHIDKPRIPQQVMVATTNPVVRNRI
jgi:hypothetical protein